MERRRGSYLLDMMHSMDLVLLFLCLIATGYGLLMIASTTNYMGTTRYVVIQAIGALIGVLIYVLMSSVNVIHMANRGWKWILLSIVVLIGSLLTPIAVADSTGNRAWLKFPFLPVSIQPVEFVKVLMIPVLAKYLVYLKEEYDLKKLRNILPLVAGFCVLFVGYNIVSSDMGSALVLLCIFAVMCFIAGMAIKWFLCVAVAGGIGFYILWNEDLIPEYMKNRFIVIFDHSIDTQGVGWHQTRSLMTLGGGKFFGQGLFNGVQTQSSYSYSLPSRHTDFIFSAIGEELGFVGCLLVIALLVLIVFRISYVARRAESYFDQLICVGVATMVAFQTLINIGMCIFVVPVIGLTLPFFSYGGSSIVTVFMAMGMVSNVQSRAVPEWLQK